MIFYIRKSFVCIFCGERKTQGKRFRYNCGICEECKDKIPMTPDGGSFAGGRYLKYMVSPLFYEGLVRDAIMRYKFEGWRCCESVFGDITEKYVRGFTDFKDFDMVVPVPLSKERLMERGFNQSLVVAKSASEAAGIECNTDSLLKIRHTKRQSRLAAKERFENVRDAYAAQPSVRGKRIILADDIYTTGITMDECARTLINAGAKEVAGIALSVKYKKEKSAIIRY